MDNCLRRSGRSVSCQYGTYQLGANIGNFVLPVGCHPQLGTLSNEVGQRTGDVVGNLQVDVLPQASTQGRQDATAHEHGSDLLHLGKVGDQPHNVASDGDVGGEQREHFNTEVKASMLQEAVGVGRGLVGNVPQKSPAGLQQTGILHNPQLQ